MNNNELSVTVWDVEHHVETKASPEEVWALFKDVAGWKHWNAGIEQIEIYGPFAAGTEFTMKPPGQDALTSKLIEVCENVGFLDETSVGDLKVYVDHRIEPIAPGRTRIVYSLEAFGPSCDEIGPMVAADFPEVLKALVMLLECKLPQAV